MPIHNSPHTRRGTTTTQLAVILAAVALAVITAISQLGVNASAKLSQTANDLGDPASLTSRFGNAGGSSSGTTGSSSTGSSSTGSSTTGSGTTGSSSTGSSTTGSGTTGSSSSGSSSGRTRSGRSRSGS